MRFLARAGARVTANDRAAENAIPLATLDLMNRLGVERVFGGHPHELFLSSDVVFVSPGVPQQLDALVQARAAGVPVSSETQLFFELCRGHIAGITGSSGKTTTTALTGEMLRRAGLTVHVGGNIGAPLIEKVDDIGPDHWVVLEMSSFQLETLPYSPQLAAVLNITPNHLDRHSGMPAYIAAKSNILSHQKGDDIAILNADDPIGRDLPTVSPAVWFSIERQVEGSHIQDGSVVLRKGPVVDVVCDVGDIRLRGRHNLANVVAATAIAASVGVPPSAMRAAISGFTGVPHRLEIVSERDGITYCNDSIATAPERAIASLRSFDQPVLLIAGGRNKKLPLGEWAELIRHRVKALILMGEAADAIEQAVREAKTGSMPNLRRAGSMLEAVEVARSLASPGDLVLLAPGCTSFDMFTDFEARGEAFRQAVRALTRSEADEVTL
ncbi:MAG: UDP-N-acetylmuramoyl-L-alanine--D-glutamate ligase [Chloroflexi bacterium]|nr:UDP-N-acetylmuramoyl-L-alanine--D-glutamate ligase [Chloroflexota bacterium]